MKTFLLVVVLLLFLNNNILESEAYKAAIINWVPVPYVAPDIAIKTSSTKIWNTLNNITNDRKSDIYIFPEYTYLNKDFLGMGYEPRDYAFDVPEESEISLCDMKTSRFEYLQIVSCAAQKKRIYVVIHVVENGIDEKLYNTILVFDRNGSLVKKHRKINLSDYEERHFTPGTTFTTFKTDFNVNFTLLTSEDIFVYDPKEHSSQTDFILCSSMYTKMPFLNYVPLFDGFSRKYQSNLLAATLNSLYDGASGFYGLNDNKVVYYTEQYYLIDNPVEPHIPKDQCESAEKPLTGIYAIKPMVEVTTENDFSNYKDNYKIRQLYLGRNELKLTSVDKKIVCEFKVELKKNDASYNAAMVYSNGEAYGCAIVACRTNGNTTCGGKMNSNTNVLSNIEIRTKFEDIDVDLFNYPISLNTNSEPIGEYNYCTNKDGISLKSKGPLTEVLTLGYYGRNPHGKNSGSYAKASLLTVFFIAMNLLQFLC